MDTSNPNEPEETSYDTTDTEDMADEGMGKGEDVGHAVIESLEESV